MFTPQRPPVIPSLARYASIAWTVCLTLLVYAISQTHFHSLAQADNASAQTQEGQRDLPSLTLLGNESRKLLRQEAVLKSGSEKNAAATALCDMYVILRLDPRYGGSKMLQGDATRIRRRLISIANRNKKALNREGVPRPPSLSSHVSANIAAAIQKYQHKLAGNHANENSPTDGKHSDIASDDAPGNGNDETLSSQGDNQANDPNPAAGQNAQGAQAAGGIPDTGWQLVELIQRIIAPDFWESRGGPGSIRYFAMRRVLVVRATTDIHEQVRDLLTALR